MSRSLHWCQQIVTKSTIAIAVIWIYLIGAGLVQGFTLPTSSLAQAIPIPWAVLIGLPIAGVATALLAGSRFDDYLPGEGLVGKWIDRRFGPDTYRKFFKQLRPELLLTCMCFTMGVVGMIRTVQLGGPSGAYKVASFFLSGGASFSVLYLIHRRQRPPFERRQELRGDEVSATSAAQFWQEARRRRNVFLASWLGWLVAGPILLAVYSRVLPTTDETVPMWAALGTWGVFFLWAGARVRQLRCFRCGKQAFVGPFSFLSVSKCGRCGATRTGG